MKSAEVRISIESPSLSEASSLLNLQEENQVRLDILAIMKKRRKKQKLDGDAKSPRAHHIAEIKEVNTQLQLMDDVEK
jgi:hypothetical protein